MAPAAVTPDKLRKSRRLTLRLIMMVSFVWQLIGVYPVEHRSIRSWILAEGNKNTIDYGAEGMNGWSRKLVECINGIEARRVYERDS